MIAVAGGIRPTIAKPPNGAFPGWRGVATKLTELTSIGRRAQCGVIHADYRTLIRVASAHPRRASQLGIDIGQTSVAKYMVRRRGPPSQGWNTFIRNHADGIAAMDLFVVPTRFVCSAAY